MFHRTYFSEQIGGAIRHLSEQDARFQEESPGTNYTHALRFLKTIFDIAVEGPEKGNLRDFSILIDISSGNIQPERLEEFVREILATDRVFTDDTSRLARIVPNLPTYRQMFETKEPIPGTAILRTRLSDRFYSPRKDSNQGEERLGKTAKRKFREAIEDYLLIPIAIVNELPDEEPTEED